MSSNKTIKAVAIESGNGTRYARRTDANHLHADFPASVQRWSALLEDKARNSQHQTVEEYYTAAKNTFVDAVVRDESLYKEQRNGETSFEAVVHLYDVRYAFYIIDIGLFSAFSPGEYSVRASSPIFTSGELMQKLAAPPEGLKTRMVFVDHSILPKFREVFEELVQFYDIDPRIVDDHIEPFVTGKYNNLLDSQKAMSRAWYMPSEAHYAPIELERTFLRREKRTTILMPKTETDDLFRTIVILLRSQDRRYSTDVVNRDFYQQSMRYSKYALENLRQPETDVETCFFRLTKLSSIELEAGTTQPFVFLQPLVRTYLLEVSQDIQQLHHHVLYYTLSTNISEFLATHQKFVPDSKRTGVDSDNPFTVFQSAALSIKKTGRSLRDHLNAPWVDFSRPHMAYADMVVKSFLCDFQRVEDQLLELRTTINEKSTFNAAQESILEARKSVKQAESITQISRLAFIFIPLTFSTSLFGMNISEWQDSRIPSIRWFILAATLCTTLTVAISILLSRLQPTIDSRGGLLKSIGFFSLWLTTLILAHVYSFVAITSPNFIRSIIVSSEYKWEAWRRKSKAAAPVPAVLVTVPEKVV